MLPEEYDGSIDNAPDENKIRDMEMQARQDMSDALRAAKGYGTGQTTDPFSSEAEAAAYKTGFDFESELARFANKATRHGSWTWFRPNRRLRTSQGVPLPSRRGKTIGCAVFVIDSSGSTDGAMVRYFLDETTEALRHLNYEKAVIIYCSDAVAKVFEFSKKEVDGKKSLFNGIIYRVGYGTALAPAFEYVAENYKDVRCITYLTDGGVGTYDVIESARIINEQLNRVPVLWLLIDQNQYAYVKRFVEWVREYRAGRCAFLPMEKIGEE
jgi:predicted metal-dependent peptidase